MKDGTRGILQIGTPGHWHRGAHRTPRCEAIGGLPYFVLGSDESILGSTHSAVHQFRPTEGTAPLPYENSIISHGKAAEIAGLSRVEFINALNQFKVSSFQYRTDEIVEEDTRR